MKSRALHILMATILILLSGQALHAQKYPERKHIRSGNKQYEQGNFPQSEVDYMRALERNPLSYEARFNLADAYYRQERYEESAQMFQQLAQDTTHADGAAHCWYNAGNALFQQRKLQEALEAYKSSLRKNPGDMDAKFNLAYVKKMLEDEQGGGGGGDNDQNQDQNQDQNSQNQQGDQNQDQNQDQGDQDKDKGDNKDDKGDKGDEQKDKGGQNEQDKGKNEQDKRKNDGKPEQQKPQGQGMTQAEAQQMLEAMQAQEDKTQDKVDEKKKVAVPVGTKRNW